MKFTLIYDGPLPPSANKGKKNEKWEIRKQFDPQLRKLWEVNQDLAHLKAGSVVRRDGRYVTMKPHPSALVSAISSAPISSATTVGTPLLQGGGNLSHEDFVELPEWIDLCAPIERGGKAFFPLVRDTLSLTCGLKIQFLKQEARGRVYQGGDLDGRLKLLLDALSVPQHDNEVSDDSGCPQPLYCLVENDALVTRLDVQAEQLLSPGPNTREDWVRLVVAVDVRVARARQFNEVFLAD